MDQKPLSEGKTSLKQSLIMRHFTPQQLARMRAGMFIIADEDLSIDDGGHNACRFLINARRTGGQVMQQGWHAGRNGVGIKNDDIRMIAFMQPSPFLQSPKACKIKGDLANGRFQGKRIFIPYPMA